MSVLFDDYPRSDAVYDEMVSPDGIRSALKSVATEMERLGLDEVRSRAEYLRSTYIDQGVTFDIGGEERPFPLDIVPRVIQAAEFAHIEAGSKQRVRAMEAFLDDVYSEGRCFTDGVIPRHVVASSPHFHRVMSGITTPNGVRIHIAGIDLIRGNDGVYRVLEDNFRCPSGVSYVMTNRRAVNAALPEVAAKHRIRPVEDYPSELLRALRLAAPSGVADPTVVVLTPGVYNSAYFEHALLARQMGVELVEGRDLVAHGGHVSLRTTRGLRPVHVIYRRIDDEFLDPAVFRADSLLGCAGLLNAARAGNVTIANAVGNGVADDKLVYTYVPNMIRYYLSEEPILASVDTWRLEEPEAREEVLDRLDELVVKPVDGSGGKGIVIGPRASDDELDKLRRQILKDARGWIAQPVVQLSTVPTMIDGELRPRHVDLRPFIVNSGNDDIFVLPGGLTRVALPEGELIVNSSQGGGSKDTWVLSAGKTTVAPKRAAPPQPRSVSVKLQEQVIDRVIRHQHEQQQQSATEGEVTPC
ncbi:MAG TPA: circularly permuted type 2 ATP-grasp protein [Tessaracoccus flavescens]|uniref:Circularly permuted type 2 ATP-grasp protein n=1 Tax=Tessaracoccus flavescens TaxID=399497 RepID=A0A921ER84_9ACTN|nr:circularly permuted type 2 ATP-grasp protein [Tessaracoccus flavescens]